MEILRHLVIEKLRDLDLKTRSGSRRLMGLD
jgi:hypothetical protein